MDYERMPTTLKLEDLEQAATFVYEVARVKDDELRQPHLPAKGAEAFSPTSDVVK
jgi:hypothetical protein